MPTSKSQLQDKVRPVDKLMSIPFVLVKIVKKLDFEDHLSLLISSKQWNSAVVSAFHTRKKADLRETVMGLRKLTELFWERGKILPRKMSPGEEIALGLEWTRIHFPALKHLRASFCLERNATKKGSTAKSSSRNKSDPVNFSLAYARSMAGMRDLESLEIGGFLVDQAGSELAIRELLRSLGPELRGLILRLPVHPENFIELFRRMEKLEKLELELDFRDRYRAGQVEASWFEIFQKLPAPDKLKALGIKKCMVEKSMFFMAEHLAGLPFPTMSCESLESFPQKFFSKYTNLQELTIAKIQLVRDPDRDRKILESILALQTLKKLDLHCIIHRQDRDAGSTALFDFFKDMENLEDLKVEIEGSGTLEILLGTCHGCRHLRSLQYHARCLWCFDRVVGPQVTLDWSRQEQLIRKNANIDIECGGKECETCIKGWCCDRPPVLGLETMKQE